MSDEDDRVAARVKDALDASVETLPPGVATRLAAVRAHAVESRRAGVRFWPMGLVACGSAAVMVLAVVLVLRSPAVPSPLIAEVAPEPDLVELEVALEMELMEDLEFVAWLALENGATETLDAS